MNYQFPVIEEGGFKYIETKGGKTNLLLLHGLFGAMSNFSGILKHFGKTHNVIVPILPIFEMPLRKLSVSGLVDYVAQFVKKKRYPVVHILGNSLGGHIALLYALANPNKTASITLTGSSGLFENSMGSTFPKRGDFDYVKKKTEATFFNPDVASEELVNEVFGMVNDRNKAIRVIVIAKSAIRHNLRDKLKAIKVPTLLIWGKQDTVTPAFVGEEFHQLIDDSRLVMLDECGHAPMMEHPEGFNEHLEDFLNEVTTKEEMTQL